MADLDLTFRRLVRRLPRPLLRLAFPRLRIEPVGPPGDPSLDRARPRTGDNLFRVRTGGSKVAVHVELERDWRPRLPRRMFDYASAAVFETDLPVSSIIVLLRRGGRPPCGTGVHRIPGVTGNTFVFRYRVVSLWQLDARRMRARLGPQGAPFCVAMRGADEDFVRSLAEEVRTADRLSERDREATMQLLFLVTVVMLGSDTAKRLFHMDSIVQDPNIQKLVSELEDKGRTEGRVEEARSSLYRVLAVRSLSVTPAVRARIDGEADLARLEAWHDAAVSAGTIDDVFRDRSARPRRQVRRPRRRRPA
jgi:hypothetical protein